DLAYLAASSRGKMELTMTEEPGEEDRLVGRLVEEAVKNVFDQYFSPKQFRNVVEYFETGATLEVGDKLSTEESLERLGRIRSFLKDVDRAAQELAPDLARGSTAGPLQVSVAEFILEGLHTHNRLNK